MDIVNIFTEDSDINIIKSWLCNSTEGETYSINNRFLPRIKVPNDLVWDFISIETEWDEVIGRKHDYRVDDPAMAKRAEEMLRDINAFIDKVNAAPVNYFRPVVLPEPQGMGRRVLLGIDKSMSSPVRKAKVVEDCTKDAVYDFIEEWNDESDLSLTFGEVDSAAQGVCDDGDGWWIDDDICVQIIPA